LSQSSQYSQKVQKALDTFGLDLEVVELEESTRTAQDAARAVGCDLGQIVKSLVFRHGDQPFLFLVSGKNRLDIPFVSKKLGIALEKANADFAREQSGFPIGGVPPVGHTRKMDTYIDRTLLEYEEIWAAAGTPHAVFRIKSYDLPRITDGRVMDVC